MYLANKGGKWKCRCMKNFGHRKKEVRIGRNPVALWMEFRAGVYLPLKGK